MMNIPSWFLTGFIRRQILLLLLLMVQFAAPQTPEDTGEVCKRYSTQYGVSTYQDPNQVYQQRYYIEDFVDDRNAQIVGVRYCLNAFGLLFKGFQVRYQTTTDFAEQSFGTLDDLDADADNCFPVDGSFEEVTEDILNFAVYADSNDVEGILFRTDSGSDLIYKANYPIYRPFPPAALKGRPIGFRVEFGHTGVDLQNTPNQPMQLQVIFNYCLCSESEFLKNAPPADMKIEALVDPPQI